MPITACSGSRWAPGGRAPGAGFLQVIADGFESLPNQDSPLSAGATPLLAFDLWEHAYYLQYHSERSRWMKAWWAIVDWRRVEQRWHAARAERAA